MRKPRAIFVSESEFKRIGDNADADDGEGRVPKRSPCRFITQARNSLSCEWESKVRQWQTPWHSAFRLGILLQICRLAWDLGLGLAFRFSLFAFPLALDSFSNNSKRSKHLGEVLLALFSLVSECSCNARVLVTPSCKSITEASPAQSYSLCTLYTFRSFF